MSMPQHRQYGSDTPTNLRLGLIAGAFAFALLLWVAGHVAARVTGASVGSASVPETLVILALRWDPATVLGAAGLDPVAYRTPRPHPGENHATGRSRRSRSRPDGTFTQDV